MGTLTNLADRETLTDVQAIIEQVRAARVEAWITLHVSREGNVVSIKDERIRGLQIP
jgi:hypothetical protein